MGKKKFKIPFQVGMFWLITLMIIQGIFVITAVYGKIWSIPTFVPAALFGFNVVNGVIILALASKRKFANYGEVV